MKLPGIDYNTSVQGLGRHDVGAPVSAARAMARAAESRANVAEAKMSSGLRIAALNRANYRDRMELIAAESRADMAKAKAIGDVVMTVVDLHASAESSRAIREYDQRMLVGNERITREKYDVVEQPDGSVKYVSRHDKIEDEYAELSRDSYDAVSASIQNPFAKKKFDEHARNVESEGRAKMYLTSIDWQHADTAATLGAEMRGAVEIGDYAAARNLLDVQIAGGLIGIDDAIKHRELIDRAEYIGGIQATIKAAQSISDLNVIKEGLEAPGALSSAGPKNLEVLQKAVIGRKGEILLAENDSAETIADKMSHYEDFLDRQEEYGLTSEEHGAIAQKLRGRVADFAAYQEKAGSEASAKGEWKAYKDAVGRSPRAATNRRTRKAVDELYDEAADALMKDNVPPTDAILLTGLNYHYLPKAAEGDLFDIINSPEPAEAMLGIETYRALMANPKVNEQLKNSSDKDSARKARWIVARMNDQVPAEKAIAEYAEKFRAGSDYDKGAAIYKDLKGNKSFIKSKTKAIEDVLDDVYDVDVDYEDLPVDMRYQLDSAFDNSYPLMYAGDTDEATTVAAQDALSSVMVNWGEYKGQLEYRSPYAMSPKEMHPYIDAEVEAVAKIHNIPADEVRLKYAEDGKYYVLHEGRYIHTESGRLHITLDPDDAESDYGKGMVEQRKKESRDAMVQEGQGLIALADSANEKADRSWLYDITIDLGFLGLEAKWKMLVSGAKDVVKWIDSTFDNGSPGHRNRSTQFYNRVLEKRVATLQQLGQDVDEEAIRAAMADEGFRNYDMFPETGRP